MKDLEKKTKDELIADIIYLKDKLKNCKKTRDESALGIKDRYVNKTLLDSIDASVFMLNLDLKYISGNRILYERLNLKESDILGKHVSEILTERTAKVFSENAMKVISNKSSITFDLDVNTKIGKSVYRVKLSPVLDDFGEVVNVLGISNDITEQKDAVHNLGYREEKFRFLIEQADDAILKGDSAGNFTYVNSVAIVRR